ncbi:MAG: PorV/PorQ family protein [bacterium]|nr:PorV/PorQ family protein [bacterium]
MRIKNIILIALVSLISTGYAEAQSKRAQTSMKFLSVSPSARAAGMSDAVTSLDMGAYGALYNPATMSQFDGKYSATVGAVQWIADIYHSSASLVYKPGSGKIGVFGFNVISVDYGDIQSTAFSLTDPEGYVDLGTISPSAMVLGLSYANALTEKFAVGVNFRYGRQDLGSVAIGLDGTGGFNFESFSATTSLIDFGILYKTGLESLNLAMAIRNFGPETQFDTESAELPLTFKMGVSMDVLDLTDLDKDTHSLLVSIDSNNSRDYDEQLMFGVEYTFVDRFVIRGGHGFPKDEESFSLGMGVKQPLGSLTLSVDYSYTAFGVFGDVQRFGAQIGF